MSTVESQEPTSEEVAKEESRLLQLAYDIYPGEQGTGVGFGAFTSLNPNAGGTVTERALANLVRDGLMEHRPSLVLGLTNANFLVITPNGIRQLGKRKPALAFDDVDHLNERLKEIEARIAERVLEAQQEQERLAKQGKEVDARLSELDGKITHWVALSKLAQDDLEKAREQLSEVEGKIAGIDSKMQDFDRAFYGRMVPFFAAFVAVFSLIINGAQTASQVISGDPSMSLQAAVIVLPGVALLGVVLIGTTFLFSRWNT